MVNLLNLSYYIDMILLMKEKHWKCGEKENEEINGLIKENNEEIKRIM